MCGCDVSSCVGCPCGCEHSIATLLAYRTALKRAHIAVTAELLRQDGVPAVVAAVVMHVVQEPRSSLCEEFKTVEQLERAGFPSPTYGYERSTGDTGQ